MIIPFDVFKDAMSTTIVKCGGNADANFLRSELLRRGWVQEDEADPKSWVEVKTAFPRLGPVVSALLGSSVSYESKD